jgi:hypothetical protein
MLIVDRQRRGVRTIGAALRLFAEHYRIARRYCGVVRSLQIAAAFTRSAWRR